MLVAGRLVMPVAGRFVMLVAGRLVMPVAGRLVVPVAGRFVMPVAGRLVMPVAGRFVMPVAGRLVMPVAGRFVMPVADLLAGPALAAGALFACGAGLDGGGVFFFWSPQTSAEDNMSTKSNVEFLRILLLSMFNLHTISCSSESFRCDLTGRNVSEWVSHNTMEIVVDLLFLHIGISGLAGGSLINRGSGRPHVEKLAAVKVHAPAGSRCLSPHCASPLLQ
jgi:hypothetical protein